MDAKAKSLYVISLNHFTNDGCRQLISTLFPVVLELFKLSYVQIGVMVAIGLIVSVLFQPLSGKVSDRVQAEKLLIMGIALISVSLILFTIATSFESLLVATIVMNIGTSFFHPVAVSAIPKSFEGNAMNKAMGFQMAFGYVGVLMSFVVGGFVYEALGWHWPFYMWAVITVFTILITLTQFKKGSKVGTVGNFSTQKSSLRRSISDKSKVSSLKDVPRSVFRIKVLEKAALPVFAGTIGTIAYTITLNFGNLTLVERGLDIASANLMIAAWVLAGFLGSLGYGRFKLYLGNTSLIALVSLITTLSSLAVALLPSPALDLPMLVIMGFACAVINPAAYSMVSDVVETKALGIAFGLLYAIQILGSALVSLASGIALQNYGPSTPFMIVAATTVTLVLLATSGGKVRKSARGAIGIGRKG